MKSMTAFSRESVLLDGVEYTLEIRTVNGRFRDISVRLPFHLRELEDQIRQAVSTRIDRGRIQLSLTSAGLETNKPNLQVNLGLARQYLDGFALLRKELQIPGDIDLALFGRLKDILVVQPPEEDLERVWESLSEGLNRALDSINRMRLREGQTISEDLSHRVQMISDLTEHIKGRSEVVTRVYVEKMTERIKELTSGLEADKDRIIQEAAFMAEKCDITEEVVRIGSHVRQFKTLMNREEPSGRKLEFLIQELHREINTIGSKAQDAEIAHWVVDAKSEIEKLREQIQNVE
ncbi:MAG: YicC family protein [Deltaproteobacteria bacterium]|nr:YicC family protein [Deltaproteobacteria bacterium]